MPERAEIVLSEKQREVLERWARRPKSSQALALRCRIVLAAAEGEESKEIAPPDAAVVMCLDEKSQIQALDRSAPILPLMPGVPERHSHDYVRNGTTNLYAALDVASGQVIADTSPRHRAEEFRRFLNLIDGRCPLISTCTWCSTTPRPTRPLRSSPGFGATRASRSTSHPPTAPGSTSSSVG
jgi:hypothetical protein